MHIPQRHNQPPHTPLGTGVDGLSSTRISHYEILKQLAFSPQPIKGEEFAQRSDLLSHSLSALAESVKELITDRRAKAKETYKQAVLQFESEVLPMLLSDILPADKTPRAQELQQLLKNAITDELFTPLLRSSGAAVITLLEYYDRQRDLERSYPEIENLLCQLKTCGYSFGPEIEKAFASANSFLKRIPQLQFRLGRSNPGELLLLSALISLPAISNSFSPYAIEAALQSFQPGGACAGVQSPRSMAVPRISVDFACDLLTSTKERLSREDLTTANELLKNPEFVFAARLNAGRFDRILGHVQAFCSAVNKPYGETPEAIGKECIHSLCQEFKGYRDDFITWKFPFSKGAAHAICREAGWGTANYAAAGWLSYVFSGGFTPLDPDGERLDLCMQEPRFLVLGAKIRRESADLCSFLTDLRRSERDSRYLCRSELEPLRLFLLGHAVPLLKEGWGVWSPDLVRWVSLNIADLQSFGGLPFKGGFAENLAKDSRPGVPHFKQSNLLSYCRRPLQEDPLLFSALTNWSKGPEAVTAKTKESLCNSRHTLKRYVEDFSAQRAILDDQELKPLALQFEETSEKSAHSGLIKAGYSPREIEELFDACRKDEKGTLIKLLQNIDKWRTTQADPAMRLPPRILVELATQCRTTLIDKLTRFISQSSVSVWKEPIRTEDFLELFHLVFDGIGDIRKADDGWVWVIGLRDDKLDGQNNRLLTTLVHSQRASSTMALGTTSIKHSLPPSQILTAIEIRRPAITLAMYTDKVDYKHVDPLDAHIMSEEVGLLRFQRECDLPRLLKASDEYLAGKRPQAPHRTYPPTSVTLKSMTPLNPSRLPVFVAAESIVQKHRLLFELADGPPSSVDLLPPDSSPADPAAAVASPLGQFFRACSKSPFEERELRTIFHKFEARRTDERLDGTGLDPRLLAHYVETLFDGLNGGFYRNIALTRDNRAVAKAIAKELKVDVLMAELRSQYYAVRDSQPGQKNIEVSFMPTIGWLMEVSGAISGSCVGQLPKIAETYTDAVFVPFVVQGDPPHFSGGAFVFEGILHSGEKVMVIRGFNPRTYLLKNVFAGQLFEAFADYVAEMARACGATKVVLPHTDYWHNPATVRPDVHFYFEETYMKSSRLKLGKCQVSSFNDFPVDFVVEVRQVNPLPARTVP